jgi:hypothetical protein
MNPCELKLSNDLAALTAEFKAFRELMDERDERYKVIDSANKDAVKAALTAAKEASAETKETLIEYKKGANEWRDTVRDIINQGKGGKETITIIVSLIVAALAIASHFVGK